MVSARVVRGTLAVVFALFFVGTAVHSASAQDELPSVEAARVSTTPDRARLIIDLSETTEYAVASIAEPNRIAVDVRAGSVPTIATQPVAGEGIVASFTTTIAGDDRVRVELVLTTPSIVQQAYLLDAVGDQPARLVVDLVTTTAEDFAARAAADLANSIDRVVPDAVASAEPAAPSSEPPPSSEVVVADVSPAAPVTDAPPAESRPLIVLDPGHGGVDNGASSPSGIHEKEITLAFALQLRDMLVASGKFDVALTRDDDTYLTLNERVDLARQNKADLLISLHADTFQEADIRGASIYTRDERAADILDKVLTEGETRADVVAGYAPTDAKPAVVDILVDLMRRQVRQQAYLAAGDIVKAMEPSVTLRRFPVRQGDFFVLQAPDIPSMLIELGFMSNSADIKNLENQQWRDKVVSAIAVGVEGYFEAVRAAQ
jgi:N-acetylmuramoyl-L-alanine amidase